LGNRSNGKCNHGGRCPLFQAQTLDLRGGRHRDRQTEKDTEKRRDKDKKRKDREKRHRDKETEIEETLR
jgi:hypothetical protein